MQRIFEHVGGVPPRLRFDNMTTAVAQVLKGTERVLTDGFTRFMLHYRFQADFCNPSSGNEKGNVENKVGYSRRNAFVPVPTITSFDEFNKYLWDWCEQDAERPHYKHKTAIQYLWKEEKDSLLALPKYPFPIFRYAALTVNKYGFAVIDTNKYGLSPSLSGGKPYRRRFSLTMWSFTMTTSRLADTPEAMGRMKNFTIGRSTLEPSARSPEPLNIPVLSPDASAVAAASGPNARQRTKKRFAAAQ
jgi:hypothetical protein